MYRKPLRACPRCRSAMGVRALELDRRRVEVDLCEGCVGAFFEFSAGAPPQLARALGELPPLRAAETGDRRMASSCASCGGAMVAHSRLLGVWRCRRCGGVFADRTGLRRLALVEVPPLDGRRRGPPQE